MLVKRLEAVATPVFAELVSPDDVALQSRLLTDVLLPEVRVYLCLDFFKTLPCQCMNHYSQSPAVDTFLKV